MTRNRLTKNAAIRLVRDKSFLLKKAYRENEKTLTIHKKVHQLSGVKSGDETVRKILNFSTVPNEAEAPSIVFATFNSMLDDNGISPIDYLTIMHHFKR